MVVDAAPVIKSKSMVSNDLDNLRRYPIRFIKWPENGKGMGTVCFVFDKSYVMVDGRSYQNHGEIWMTSDKKFLR